MRGIGSKGEGGGNFELIDGSGNGNINFTCDGNVISSDSLKCTF